MSSSCNLIASSSSSSFSSSPLCSEFESLALKTNSQWLDLPADVTEKILECLPITSYVRFASVCCQWRTIQQNHRLRHSPSPPPMLNLPFFIPFLDQQTLTSPFDPHHPPPPFILNVLSKRKYPSPHNFSSSFPCGCLLLQESPASFSPPDSFYFTLMNPISDAKFCLPVCSGMYYDYKAAMSLTGPDSWSLFLIIFRFGGNDLLFFRQGDKDWTRLRNEDIVRTRISCARCSTPSPTLSSTEGCSILSIMRQGSISSTRTPSVCVSMSSTRTSYMNRNSRFSLSRWTEVRSQRLGKKMGEAMLVESEGDLWEVGATHVIQFHVQF